MEQEGNVMLFRKPRVLRRQQRTLFWLFLLISFGALAAGQIDFRNYVNGVIGLSLSSILLYLSGPDDIRLDGNRRTYARIVGWPWKPKTRYGSFDGIEGVCISRRNTVWLLMEKPDFIKSSGAIALGYFGESQSARALAEELNQAYGFPILPYPKNGL